MSAVKTLNPNAETMGANAALFMNINAAKGLHDVMKTNLGPKGTIKMLVGGAGDIKLTKDGNVLLREMQIQNPTAVMIARTAVAQDDVTGWGGPAALDTPYMPKQMDILLIGEVMKQSERYISEGLHPRVLVEGFDLAKKALLEYLESVKIKVDVTDREILYCAAKTSLRTKLSQALADQLTDIVTDSVLTIKRPGEPLDLHMVEIMHMRHKLTTDSKMVRGLVLDHGARHPDMPKRVENAFVLTCNISLEYEKSEVNSGFFYSNAEQREKLVAAEREYTDARVRAIIDLKKKVCTSADQGFVVINMKGIDPFSLDLLAKEGIMALRRAKKRNMERLVLACGGISVNSVEELTPDCLGYAGCVYEHILGEEKYTFVEDVKNPHSCTILLKAPNDHAIAQMKEALRDGLRAVKNTIEDGFVIRGAGSFEIGASQYLLKNTRKQAEGRAKLGVEAFAEALLGVPKTLAENAGFDAQETIIAVQDEHEAGNPAGIDLTTGEPIDPISSGIYDSYCVKRQIIQSAPVVASQLLLVDEVMRAGMNMRKR